MSQFKRTETFGLDTDKERLSILEPLQNKDSHEVLVPGDSFGHNKEEEIYGDKKGFYKSKMRTATAVALSQVRALIISDEDFRLLYKSCQPKEIRDLVKFWTEGQAAAPHLLLFKLMEKETVSKWRKAIEKHKFREKKIICKAGEPSSSFFILLSGQI